MIYKLRSGETIKGNDGQDRLLSALYGHLGTRILMKLIIRPHISRIGGIFLDSPFSKFLIQPFIRKNRIDMDQYESQTYSSYNDFFTRRIKPEKRLADQTPQHLISPCDGKLSAYPVTKDGHFYIKQTFYSLESLLRSKSLAAKYEGGMALVFRLTVDDYHRYCYVDAGEKSRNIIIPGVLHTVNPAANDVYPIYKENSREYCLLKSQNFKTLLIMEVGALMVGKISNYHQDRLSVSRGQEKGRFEFGGSTVIMLLEQGAAKIDSDILKNTSSDIETIVKMGEKIGTSHKFA